MNFSKSKISIPTASTISKLVTNTNSKEKLKKVELATLENIAHELVKKNKVLEDMLTLMPDLEFCADTATSSIISPNDLTTKSIVIDFENISMGSELKGTIADTISTDLDVYYKLKNNLNMYVKDSLFIRGANVEAYIPEASMSEIIGDVVDKNPSNKTTLGYGEISIETALKKIYKSNRKGIFSNNNIDLDLVLDTLKTHNDNTEIAYEKISTETLTNESGNKKTIDVKSLLNVEFIDNISVLFSSDLEVKQKLNEINNVYTTETAGDNIKTDELLDSLFIKADDYTKKDIITIKEYNDTKRESIGRPLKLELDMEIAKPIWAGKPNNHIGYLVPLDENFNMVKPNSSNVFFNGSKGTIPAVFYSNNNNMKENLINKAMEGLTKMTTELPDLTYIEDIYGDILHKTIVKKLKDGKFKDIGEFSKDQKFLHMMFSRALEGKQTKLIFIPESMVSYFAYDYHDNGVGRSRMDRIQVILSMRIIMMFAKMMANINNSIPKTVVNATIDKDSPDIIKAMNDIIVGTAKYHQSSLPIGASSVNDVLNWVQTAGYRYKFDSERLPDTKIDFEDTSRNIKTPEDTISEDLEEKSYMAFFMNGAMVKSGMEANFATTIVSQNKLFENRIVTQQIITEYLLSDRVKKIIRNDNHMRISLKKIISDNLPKLKNLNKETFKEIEKDEKKKDSVISRLLDIFIDNLVVKLPRPTNYSEGSNLKAALADYKAMVEEFVDSVMSDEMLSSDLLGEGMAEKIQPTREIIKKMLMIEWIHSNNHLPAMADFLTLDEDGESNNNLLTKHIDMTKTLSKLFMDYYDKNSKEIKENNKEIEKIDDKYNNEESEEDEEDDTDNLEDDNESTGNSEEESNEEEDNLEEEEEEVEEPNTEENNPEEDDDDEDELDK